MVGARKNTKSNKRDDSLFGLLSMYKRQASYIRVLVSEQEKEIVVHLTDNPLKWRDNGISDDKRFQVLRRLELGVSQTFVKYLKPGDIVRYHGEMLGMKIPPERVRVNDSIDRDGNYYLAVPLRYRAKVILGVKKLLNLSPAKKYEIIETNMAKGQE